MQKVTMEISNGTLADLNDIGAIISADAQKRGHTITMSPEDTINWMLGVIAGMDARYNAIVFPQED